jgi:hypothetical protein
LPLPTDRGDLFSGSGACGICHTNLQDEAGVDVSLDTFWRSTMMANAARDPYWQAAVRLEVEENPELRSVIEDKCATCHMPMARTTILARGREAEVLDGGLINPENDLHALAMDGVSCTLCHQIEEDQLGNPASFSGGYVIDLETPMGERVNFGPYPVGQGAANIMQSASGFIPVEGPHMSEPEFCATCHTLYTPYLDSTGEVAGEFPEQMAYFEWGHSAYQGVQVCQDCHMPIAEGEVPVSNVGGQARAPFYQHVFVGGNAYILRILQAYAEELGVTASTDDFEATIGRVLDQLQNRTANVSLEDVSVTGAELGATVVVENNVGHKFPTGFPSRRTWLHFSVVDGNGDTVFESGAYNNDGSIVGNDNDDDMTLYEPHYEQIESPDQVQIYETILQDTEGSVTTVLLLGSGYAKDNRLLPAGFDKATAEEQIAVHGLAADDQDFSSGEDRVRYLVELGSAQGPFAVRVELLYQSIGYRWADNTGRDSSTEGARFADYYSAISNLPVVVTSVEAVVQ